MIPSSALADRTSDLDKNAYFEAALNRHRRRLFSVAYAILRSPAEAEDALQETMWNAWKSWHQLKDQDNEAAWLTRICVNYCIRRKGLLSRWSGQPSQSAATSERVDGRLLDLERSVRALSRQQRAALVLNYYFGYSVDECADLMGCRPGSVRTHIARALARLRRQMADSGDAT